MHSDEKSAAARRTEAKLKAKEQANPISFRIGQLIGHALFAGVFVAVGAAIGFAVGGPAGAAVGAARGVGVFVGFTIVRFMAAILEVCCRGKQPEQHKNHGANQDHSDDADTDARLRTLLQLNGLEADYTDLVAAQTAPAVVTEREPTAAEPVGAFVPRTSLALKNT